VRPRPVFSVWLTRVNLMILFFLGVTAQAASTSSTNATVTAVWNSGTGKIDWTYNLVHGASSYGAGWLYRVSGDGVTSASAVVFDVGANPNSVSSSGSYTATEGQWFLIVARTHNLSNAVIEGPNQVWLQAVANYYVDFHIPVNLSGNTVNVKIYQGGVLKTTLAVADGEGNSDLHVTGLGATGLVTAVYSYGSYEKLAGGSIVFTADTNMEVAGGTDPTAAAEPPEPTELLPFRLGSKIVKEIPSSLTPTTPPTALPTPTATTQPSAQTVITKHVRSAFGIPFGTPSGTNPTTKADNETGVNAIAAAIDNADANRAGSDDKAMDALNGIAAATTAGTNANVSAIDSLRSETTSGVNKQLDAASNLNTTLTSLRNDVRDVGSKIDGLTQAVELSTTGPKTEQSTPAMASVVSVGNDFMESVASATEVQPETGTVAADDTDAGSGMPDVTLPGTSAGGHTPVTMSLNPLQNAEVKQLADLLRALIGWLVLFSLIAWTYMQIPIWMTQAMQGGSGFTAWRAAVGAIPMIGIAVMTVLVVAGGAVLLTAPTIMWAYADPLMMGSSGTALIDVRDVITSYGGPNAGLMISLMDAFMPTGLVMTAAFNFITLKIGGQSICAALIAFSKVLAS